MRLVNEAQPSVAIARPCVGRIEKHPAPRQDPVGFGDERTDPPHVEVAAGGTIGAGEAFVDEGTHRRLPMPPVRDIDRELLRTLRDPYGAAHELEAGGGTIEGEYIDALADAQDERGLRTVGHEPGRELRGAALAEGQSKILRRGENREDRADGYVDVDIRRTVERIDRDADLCIRIVNFGLGRLFRSE